jgi:hypothetical protein
MPRVVFASLLIVSLAAGTGAAVGITPAGRMVVTDPVWFEEPAEHNTFAPTDLTELRVVNGPDELRLDIPFASDWDGLQLHVLLESRFDAAGASADPFVQPVVYGHSLRPDCIISCRYSADDFGDCRHWNSAAGRWEWYDPATNTWSTSDPANIIHSWAEKRTDQYSLRIPWGPFGGRPDSLMVAVYLTQDDGVKRSAFDSVPSDATLDLDFDWENPAPGDWDAALQTVTLRNWSPVYHVRTEFPAVPQVVAANVTPDTARGGDSVRLTAAVADAGDGVGSVVVDLHEWGASAEETLYDDGATEHGDDVAGDGIYSLLWILPQLLLGRDYQLAIRAYDIADIQYATAGCTLTVLRAAPLVQVQDAVGDDHGPNQPGVIGMYYTYPTGGIFATGAFDLTGLAVFETMGVVGGSLVPMIAFEVAIEEFPSPDDPGAADWNPYYAELNLEKIDILIDSAPGGATASLPGRGAGFQDWDAWDYAVIMDGWYKAFIPSRGQNTLESWRANALRSDADIQLIGDPVANTVTALVAKTALGNPTPEDIRSWDIIVCMASHDFGGEEVLGGIRWVTGVGGQWNFGGGSSYDWDSNLIDLLRVAGEGKSPGRAQEVLLDYRTDEAVDRLAQGLTAVALEATSAEPQSVYLVRFQAERQGSQAVIRWAISRPRAHAGFHVWRETPGSDRVRLNPVLLTGQATYDFVDPAPPIAPTAYWLQEVTTEGAELWYGPAPLPAATVPGVLTLSQNQPNPFNPGTTFNYSLPEAGRVHLAIYDVRGSLLATLVATDQQAGHWSAAWNGLDRRGVAVPAGIYIARLETSIGVRTVKVTLAK